MKQKSLIKINTWYANGIYKVLKIERHHSTVLQTYANSIKCHKWVTNICEWVYLQNIKTKEIKRVKPNSIFLLHSTLL